MDLVIPDGKFVVITGPNGGGKSTLAKTIMGINHISSGRLIFDGEDITAKNITERAKLGISFAFQQPVHFKLHAEVGSIKIAHGILHKYSFLLSSCLFPPITVALIIKFSNS